MSDALPKLRQRLRGKLAQVQAILGPAIEGDPIFPGNVFSSWHRCGKKGCRCTRGQLHPAVRLQIRFKDGTANRCLGKETEAFWRARTQAYKRLRDAERSFRRWQREVVEILEAIERERCSSQGLCGEDAERSLR